MTARKKELNLNEAQPGVRLSNAVLPVALGLIALIVLSSAPASWAAPTSTVPRETPTRRATSTVPAIDTPVPTLSPTALPTQTSAPTATAVAGQPTATPVAPSPTALAAASPTTGQATAVPTTGQATATLTTGQATAMPTAVVVATQTSQTPSTTSVSATATTMPSLTPTTQPPPPQTVTMTAIAPKPASTPRAGGACGAAAQVVWPDGRALLEVPAASLTAPICIYLDMLEPAALPAAPAGFRLATPAARLWVADLDGTALSGYTFAQPISLTLRFDITSGAAPDITGVDIGFLGETSNDWAVVDTQRNTASLTLTTHARRPGVYALLVRLSAPAASPPASGSDRMADLRPFAALAIVILALAVLFIVIVRRHGTNR